MRADVRVLDRELDGPVGPVRLRHHGPYASCSDRRRRPALLLIDAGDPSGGPDADDLLARVATELGWHGFSIECRRSSDHSYPAMLDDGEIGVRWVASNAGRLGVDPKLILVGAGGFGAGAANELSRRLRHSGGPAVQAVAPDEEDWISALRLQESAIEQ